MRKFLYLQREPEEWYHSLSPYQEGPYKVGPQNQNKDGFLGPNSIMVTHVCMYIYIYIYTDVYMDPLGYTTTTDKFSLLQEAQKSTEQSALAAARIPLRCMQTLTNNLNTQSLYIPYRKPFVEEPPNQKEA